MSSPSPLWAKRVRPRCPRPAPDPARQSGTRLSDLISALHDDIAVIRSCWTNGINHSGVCQMNTCTNTPDAPSRRLGQLRPGSNENSRLSSSRDNRDGPSTPPQLGQRLYLASHQGVRIDGISATNPSPSPRARRRTAGAPAEKLALLTRSTATRFDPSNRTEARIRSHELPFRMQAEAPAATTSTGSPPIPGAHGIGEKETDTFGRNCPSPGASSNAASDLQLTAAPAAMGFPRQDRARTRRACRSMDNPSPLAEGPCSAAC